MIGLPGEINPDKVDASLENGILTVMVAKAEAAKPKQITIKEVSINGRFTEQRT